MTTALASRIMPRTTFDLDATVLADLRSRARVEGKSMGQLASELLALGLGGDGPPAPDPLAWARKDMGAFKVDLEDKAVVQELLDREELARGAG